MTNNTQRPSSRGTGCAVLFLLPFALVGAVMIGLTLWTLFDWQRMQHWEEASARLLSLELQHGEETERIRAKYEYTYDGRQYTGDRVALHQMGDNLGTYQKRNYRRLKEAKDAERNVVVYVNPSNPNEAVLLRELRPEMLALKAAFGFIFGLVGIGGLVGVVITGRQLKGESAVATQQPDKPWLWREDWRAGVIRVSGSGCFWSTFILAMVWNALCWTSAVGMLLVDKRATPIAIGVLIVFNIIGAGLLYLAGVMLLRWRRFPYAKFRMANIPGEIGGQLAGVVLLPTCVRPRDGFRVGLKCARTVRSGKHSRQVVLWHDEQTIDRTLDEDDRTQTAIPVQFAIPTDVEPSDPHASDPVRWNLTITAKLPGPNLDFTFELPVFRTERADHTGRTDAEVVEA
ncbi:DUF3592 domain-containing protein [Aeoliella sp.]|uniref:DUF3592 domain-containing protein n=1 Tax=Aeoliella sp. TaxID=2795800 RepID=UPI003CCC4491